MEHLPQPIKQLAKVGATAFLLFLSALFFTPRVAAQASYNLYLPILSKSIPVPVLQPLVRSASSNSWTASWNQPTPDITQYEIREAPTATFESALYYNTNATNYVFTQPATIFNTYCYQVRVLTNNEPGQWSNTQCIVGDYFDDFSSSGSGWGIRRQDTDDVNNSSFYENGEFVLRVGGQWDYAIASSLGQAPTGDYQLETRVRLDSPKNVHAYGIIFGGDWNGQPCPASNYSSCFTHYYRLLIIWQAAPSGLHVSLKRIDSHDQDNVGRGVTLISHRNANVSNPNDWNTWTVQVRQSGDIAILVNGRTISSVKDTTYIHDRYFGVMAATDDLPGSEPHFESFTAKLLP